MNELIYNVGMVRGEDTAYYLAEGFRVVGLDHDVAERPFERLRERLVPSA